MRQKQLAEELRQESDQHKTTFLIDTAASDRGPVFELDGA